MAAILEVELEQWIWIAILICAVGAMLYGRDQERSDRDDDDIEHPGIW